MFDWTSQNALIGLAIGALFGNCFPFPPHWWNKCRTPVGIMLVMGLGYYVYVGA